MKTDEKDEKFVIHTQQAIDWQFPPPPKNRPTKKERIYAIISKPNGRGEFRSWRAFSFNSKANQGDVEAFMYSVHQSNYFLHYESQLERVKPYPACPKTSDHFYYTSKKYGRHFVCDTPVNVFYDWHKIKGKKCLKGRMFQLV